MNNDFYNMDETLEEQPVVELNSRQVKLLKMTDLEVGDEIELTATGTVIDMNEYEEDDGTLAYTVTLELRLAREDTPEDDEPAKPTVVKPQAQGRFYDNSNMK